jgi:uncharacterized protein (DUF924 family)
VGSEDEGWNAAEILSFWFSERVKPKWFEPDAAFDAELNDRFRPANERARAGELNSWTGTPEGALALVILLDQSPRNIERGSPKAFATDEQALAIAGQAVARGFDAGLDAKQRQFLYLPFMHSENLEDQERGMELYTALGLAEPLDFMRRHRDVIARFRRFPHRNEVLGRKSTEAEIDFLNQPGSSF